MALPRPIPDALVELLAHRLRVVGQPIRIRMIDLLDQCGEASVQELVDELATTQQNVSKHLGVLQQAGVLHRRRAGRTVLYRIADATTITVLDHVGRGILEELRRTGEESDAPGEAR